MVTKSDKYESDNMPDNPSNEKSNQEAINHKQEEEKEVNDRTTNLSQMDKNKSNEMQSISLENQSNSILDEYINSTNHEREDNKSSVEEDQNIQGNSNDTVKLADQVMEETPKHNQEEPVQTIHTSSGVEINNEDAIPSGTGLVTKDCSASDLQGWSELLPKWHSKLNQRPKGLDQLVKIGIPDPLRGEVWQLLSGAHEHQILMDDYRLYLTRQASTEQIILRDVHRTYPAHENFRSDSLESKSLIDSLYKVCKAYAVYDEEVGYCQGLSFLVAALLLHMPEEQAFCVTVRIMYHYGLRNLFKNNFDELYLRFYQLEHLIEDQIPDLHQHFKRIGLEPFTYASQWFLTIFTAKFPLNAVFHIMDIFLLDGMDTIFQIALALLKLSKQEILACDFEGVLKFFRVSMPKRYMDKMNLIELINISRQVNLKKLAKYKKSYELAKQKEKMLENPLIRLQRENAKLTENNLRLERENDDLARDLVASKIQLRSQLDITEDKLDALRQELESSQLECRTHLSNISDMEDEKARLEVEVNQLKEVCRRELSRAESELNRDSNIISDYKKICSQLGKRFENRIDCMKEFIEEMDNLIAEKCTPLHEIYKDKAQRLLVNLMSDEEHIPLSNEEQTKSRPIIPGDSINNRKGSNSSGPEIDDQKPLGAFIKSSKNERKMDQLLDHINHLEVELARTKLALVEAECKCQQLTHDLNLGASVKTSPMVTNKRGTALAKINSILGEKLSSLSGPYIDQLTGNTSGEPSSPTHLAKSLQRNSQHNTTNNNDKNVNNNYHTNRTTSLGEQKNKPIDDNIANDNSSSNARISNQC